MPMATTSIPIKIYEILEDKLGREKANEITREIETAIDAIALQKKVEIKDELDRELLRRGEFIAEMKTLRIEMQNLRIEIESKLKLYFLILLFTIILVSPNAIELISKLLGIIK